MQVIQLYRYIREDGGVTVSTVKPDAEYSEVFRLVADEGYVLTDGVEQTLCTDTATPADWSEVEWNGEHDIDPLTYTENE